MAAGRAGARLPAAAHRVLRWLRCGSTRGRPGDLVMLAAVTLEAGCTVRPADGWSAYGSIWRRYQASSAHGAVLGLTGAV